ncbi:MAG: putative serine protease PepD [Thermoleophilales bacterium]|nr:putative serine protease PepD [Thermoleophilales bacterium]
MATPTLDQSAPPNGHPGRAPATPPPGRRGPLTRVVLATAALSAVVTAVVLLAVGAVGNSTTTVAQQSPARSSLGGALNTTALYAGANPGVVDITASGIKSTSGSLPFTPPGSTTTATGTGFTIDGKGDILTASHVVNGASSITVKLQNGTRRTATVLGVDRSTDVAVLKINPSGLTLHPLPLGSSQALAVGDQLAVVGDPFQFDRSLSTGVVSALDRTIQAPNGFDVAHAIQTDAPINPGNSGGPVLNANGGVVGIVDQIATGSSSVDSSTGVGFAVPIDVVKGELTQLEQGVHVAHSYLGAATAQATTQQGALVASVVKGSPAAAAGLHTGDVITAIGGTKVAGPNAFIAAINALKPGTRVTLSVTRGSSHLTVTATLGTQPSQAPTG